MPTPNIPPPDPEDDMAPYWVTGELQDAYHLALGRFFDAYGQTESILSHYLTRFSARCFGKDDAEGLALARAMLGAQRSESLKATLKKLAAAAGVAEKFQKEIDDALSQLHVIRNLRDRIIHSGAFPEFYEGKWSVRTSNHNQVRLEADIVETYFTIEDLDAMRRDLSAIEVRVRHALFTTGPLPEWRELAESTRRFRDAHGPWHYKPHELKTRSPVRSPKPSKP